MNYDHMMIAWPSDDDIKETLENAPTQVVNSSRPKPTLVSIEIAQSEVGAAEAE